MTNPLDAACVNRFASLVTKRFGFAFDASKYADWGGILARGVERSGAVDANAYLDFLQLGVGSTREFTELVSELSIHETYFFRNSPHFQALSNRVIPDCVRANQDSRRLRILSAGCSSGEEAYSCLMVLREGFPHLANWDITITGIDLNANILGKARRARYSAWALRETPIELQKKYFQSEGADFVLDPSIQKAVVWEQRNLMDPDPDFWHAGAFDVILCRNVLMYFSVGAMREIIERFTDSLQPHGFLFLGHSETLRGLSEAFRVCHTHETFYYAKGVEKPQTAAAQVRPSLLSPNTISPLESHRPTGHWVNSINDSSFRIQGLAEAAEQVPAPQSFHADHTDRIAELMSREKYAEALTLMDSAPIGELRTSLLRCMALIHCARLEEAEQSCRQVLGIDDLNAEVHFILALCREYNQDIVGAVEQHQIAAYLDPCFMMPHLHLGLLARRAGDAEMAHRELRHALVLLPGEDAARILLFGGGFTRDGLLQLSNAELRACA